MSKKGGDDVQLSLLKMPSDHGIGLPMKAMADDFRFSAIRIERCSLATQSPRMGPARLHPSDAIADGDDARHRDRGAGSVNANRSGCATFVAMAQSADLWECNSGICRGWLYRTRLWGILG